MGSYLFELEGMFSVLEITRSLFDFVGALVFDDVSWTMTATVLRNCNQKSKNTSNGGRPRNPWLQAGPRPPNLLYCHAGAALRFSIMFLALKFCVDSNIESGPPRLNVEPKFAVSSEQ